MKERTEKLTTNEFNKRYPCKEAKIAALKEMTNEEIQTLIDSQSNVYGKIFYAKYLKK